MDLYCTRPGCPRPSNTFSDLDDNATLKTVQQKYCTTCGMGLILVGRYLPLKLLGQGGFGAAFLARDRYTPGMRQCVVKQFQPSGNLSPSQLEVAQNLFEREGEVLEHLGNAHPQIPDLFAFFELTVPSLQPGKQDKFFYLVQEFIDGVTLEEELEQKGPFSSIDTLEMLEQILKVLKFVHENGSIHRDIKPSNIMRHRNGRFYLLDFGAVRQATKGGAGSVAKSTGIYSLGFAPPEQVSGSEVYPSTDLYALAVTCITLLTGKPPNELFDSYANTWDWRKHATRISQPLANVLDRMLLSTPSQRYHSATEVLEALKPRSGSIPPPPKPASSASSNPGAATPISPPTRAPAQPAAQPAAQPSAQSAVQPAPKSVLQRQTPSFSTLELLSGAAFTGFEGGLLAIALLSLLGTTVVSAGFWLVLVVGLVVFQSRRVIERADLLIIAGLTLAIVLIFSVMHRVAAPPGTGNVIVNVLFIAVLTALLAVMVTALFRLVHKLLSTLL